METSVKKLMVMIVALCALTALATPAWADCPGADCPEPNLYYPSGGYIWAYYDSGTGQTMVETNIPEFTGLAEAYESSGIVRRGGWTTLYLCNIKERANGRFQLVRGDGKYLFITPDGVPNVELRNVWVECSNDCGCALQVIDAYSER